MYYRSYHNHNKYQFKVEKSFFSIALSSVIGKTKIKINLHNNISFALHFFLNIYRLIEYHSSKKERKMRD